MENRFAYWHSRKDRGHWDAVHQGFQKATGDILYFLNSDDLLMNHTVERIVESFQQHPEVALCLEKRNSSMRKANTFRLPEPRIDIQHVFRTWENPVPQPSHFSAKNL